MTVPASLALEVAHARDVTALDALDSLVQDALLAQAARAARLDDEPPLQWTSVAAIAKLVPERLYDESRSRGAPDDDELATVRVVHAVVHRSPTLTRSAAQAIADAVLHAAAGAHSDEDFEARAARVPHPGTRVTVEHLPDFDASGHATGGQEFDATFVAAAFALHTLGETSPIVETPFGWHVIRLIERSVPDAALLEQRRRDLSGAVVELRARARLVALLNARRRRTPVEVMADADELMGAAASLP
jgi:hypothetical protein